MRAAVHDTYGGPEVLHLSDVDRPSPGDGDVLIKVHATTVNRTDIGFLRGKPIITRFFSGLVRPRHRILGSEYAGIVEAVGEGVTEFAVGDEVFGVSDKTFGAHAEYVCVRDASPIAAKPSSLSFVEAASICDGAILGLSCLRGAKLRSGQRILIYGASGAIGTAAVQLAKHLGAHVTAVCNTKHVDLARSLGADEVIDYTATDFTATGETYDVVFDSVGKTSFRRCRALVGERGVYVETDLGFLWHVPLLALSTRALRGKRVTLPLPAYSKKNVLYIKNLVDEGAYRPVIDTTYPLDDIAEATRYVETEQKTGSVVITVVAESS